MMHVITTLGAGVATADPTWAIAVSWGASACVLGGLMVFAYLGFRNSRRAP